MSIKTQMTKWSYLFGAFAVCVVGVMLFVSSRETERVPEPLTLLLLNSLPHSSFDPLYADYSHNRQVARLLYATPLEVSRENRLVSAVLEKFSFDENTGSIHLTVRPDITFSDGSELTVHDVVIAILRLALNRPYFPLTKRIDGIQDWFSQRHPLKTMPRGILIDGRDIRIQLDHPVQNSLFRLTLEVFSIIPSKCIDLETGGLICEKPPFSGAYALRSADKTDLIFSRRFRETPYGEPLPEVLRLSFVDDEGIKKLKTKFSSRSVLSGWEAAYWSAEISQISGLETRWLPRSWFTTLILNPNISVFRDKSCRRQFANLFRQQYKALNDPEGMVEGSIFTSILPGYMSFDELENSTGQNTLGKQDCRTIFVKEKIPWSSVSSATTPFRRALTATLESLGPEISAQVNVVSYDQVLHSFFENQTGVLGYSSGFWAQDPIGDLQMFLTPGLHPPLKLVTGDP